MIVIQGHKFLKDRERGWKIEWRCSRKRKLHCRANIVTVKDKIVRYHDKHNHDADPKYLGLVDK